MSFVRRWGRAALVAALAGLALSSGAARGADEASGADAQIHKTLRDVINEGADMYNATGKYANMERDYAGCYHLYQGALIAVRPELAAHPDLQKAIDDGLAAAAATPQVERRAFVLRAVIDRIRDAVNPRAASTTPPTPPTSPPTPPPPEPKETTAAGTAVAVAVDQLTMNVGGEEVTVTVPAAAKVTVDGKDAKLEDIKKGAALVVASRGGSVVRVEAKAPAVPTPPPPPPPAPAKEVKTTGKVTKVDKDQLTLRDDDGKEKTFTVPDTAEVLIDGKAGLLGDVKNDSGVTVTSKGDAVTKVEAKAPAAPTPPPPAPEAKTLWDRLGGEATVAKVVDDFVNTAGKDPKVNIWRDPTHTPSKEEVANLKKGLVAFFSSASGGPLKYEGKDMKDLHKGMKITNAEFDQAAIDLRDALDKNGVKPEDVKAVLALVETTRKAIVEEPGDATPPPAPAPDKDKTAAPGDKDKAAPTDKDKAPPADKDKPAAPDK